MKTAVVIVHGVGDPKDGDALAGLMAGLRDSGYRQVRAPEVEQRVQPGDKAAGGRQVATYPVHRASMEPGDEPGASTLELHEVYWGDLSRVKGSAIGLLLGLFDLVFGLRHVASVAARDALLVSRRQGGWGKRVTLWAGWAARAAEHIARGPMLALNILLASVALSHWMLGRVSQLAPNTVATAASWIGSLVVLVAIFFVRPALRSRQWSMATLNWLVGVSLGALMLASRLSDSVRPLAFIEDFTTAMSIGAFMMALAAVLMMWLSMWAVWLLWLRRDPPVPPPATSDAPHRALARALVVVNFSTAFGVGLFVLLVMMAWTALGAQVPSELKGRITQGLHLFGLVWVSFLAVAFVFMLIALANWRLKTAGSPCRRQRYIVNPVVCAVFLGLSFAYALLFLPLCLCIESKACCEDRVVQNHMPAALREAFVLDCLDRFTYWPALNDVYERFVVPIEQWKAWAIASTLAFLAIGAATRLHALQALDVLLDVVAHFQTGLPIRIGAGRFRSTHPTWEAITDRLVDVLEHVGDVQRVVMVTHSQGTTVALCALGLLRARGRRSRAVKLSSRKYDLVTMGSPADHLYRHYMPNTYGSSARSTIVEKWLNVYRRDDYIGTALDFGDARWPVNQPVAPRGHAAYWNDREVLQHLVPFIRQGSLPLQRDEPIRFNDELVLVRGPEGGAPVMLMHELPGLTQFCLDLAGRLAQQGFRVYMPLLVGQVGQRAAVINPFKLCVRREFWRLAFATDGHDDASMTEALRALCRDIASKHPSHAGIGVVGMCLTGGFALATLLDPNDKVLAAVASQPSMPLALGACRKKALGLGPASLDQLRKRLEGLDGAKLMALRFANDLLCPPERFESLKSLLVDVADDRFVCIALPSGSEGIPANAHSVLTEAYASWPGHPAREAFDEIVVFLNSKPQPAVHSKLVRDP